MSLSAEQAPASPVPFLNREGRAAAMVRDRDWSSHPLGPPQTWPPALRVALGIVLASPESMFLAWGPELSFFFNDTYMPLLGPRVDTAIGAPFRKLWADAWDQARPIVEDALAGRASRFVNLPWKLARRGVEEQTWFTFSYSPIRDEDGRVAGLFCVTNETTDQALGAAQKKADESRNRQILDSATDYAVIATDLGGRVTRWNEGARRTLGWGEEEMLGEPVDRFFTPEDLAADRPAIERRLARNNGSGTDERWHRRRSGERFWANGEMTPLLAEDGGAIGYVKVLRDRTEQRRSQEALRASQAELAAALEKLRAANAQLTANVAETTAERDHLWDTSPDLLMVTDAAGVIRASNPAWRKILDWRLDEVVGRQFQHFVHPDDLAPLASLLENAFKAPIAGLENRYRHKDGSYRWMSWVAAPSEQFIYYTGRHISARKAAEEALRQTEEVLRQSQKVEAVGQLTGGVAHDFNNLLTVIRGSVDLLRRPGVSDEKRLRYIDAISDTSDRATKLLAFARRQALKPEVFDAGQSLAGLSDMVGTLAGSRIKVTLAIGDCPCFIDADRSQFDTAIVNMAVNARDAMGGEGDLVIRAGIASGMPAVRSHPFVPGEFVTIALTDTGAGIEKDKLDRIFEPFFTTKGVGEGTGLGLSQVFGFAKQSGSDILVESSPGDGSTFTLYLPLAVQDKQADAEAADADADVPTIGKGACVLVVDDNAEVGTFARQALAELGYDAVLAIDGASALVELSACGERFDVVFSDVVMPGMSGIDFGQEVRRLYPALPVILTSGYSTVLARNGTLGFELLHKPYSIEELSPVLRKVALWRPGR